MFHILFAGGISYGSIFECFWKKSENEAEIRESVIGDSSL